MVRWIYQLTNTLETKITGAWTVDSISNVLAKGVREKKGWETERQDKESLK